MTPPPETGRGLVRRSRSERGESGRVDGEGRHREEGIHGRENPEADRDLIAQVEDGK